jgi:hypothetical protein
LFNKVVVYHDKLLLQHARDPLHIALNIKTLVLTDSRSSTYEGLNSEYMETILPLLPNLECLSVNCVRFSSQPCMSSARSNFKLKELQLDHLPWMSALRWIRVFNQVDAIFLDHIHYDLFSLAQAKSDNQDCVYVRDLRMGWCIDQFATILLENVIRPATLQRLHMRNMPDIPTAARFTELLRPVGQAVTYLALDVGDLGLTGEECMFVSIYSRPFLH